MASLPALLTNMCMFLSVCSRYWAHCRTDASEDRSRDTTTTWPASSTSLVSRRMSSAACSAFCWSRHAMMTRAPAVGNGTGKCWDVCRSCILSRFYSICDLPSLTERPQVVFSLQIQSKDKRQKKKVCKAWQKQQTKIMADPSLHLRVRGFLLFSKKYMIW